MSGKNRPVLTFTFDNILLPDSTSNEPGSHGFVQFSVQPKAGLVPKTRIDNFSDIYFDYNEPVRTNSTVNRIYDVPAGVAPAQQLQPADIIVSPTIAGFTPAQGPVGTLVTLTGTHFAPLAEQNQVRFQGVEAPVLSATATTLTVRVPPGAAPGPLQVVTANGGARSATAFTVVPPATVTAGGGPARSPAEAISVYPNPTTGTVTVSWPATTLAVHQVQVLDAVGRPVFSRDVRARATETLTLELSGQRAGLYLLVVQTAQGTLTKRLTLL